MKTNISQSVQTYKRFGRLIIVCLAGVLVISPPVCMAKVINGMVKVSAIIKQDEVEFRDKKGKITNKVSLQPETRLITRTRKIGNKEDTYKIKQNIRKSAISSENGTHTLIIVDRRDQAFVDDHQNEQQIDEGQETGGVIVFDSRGKLLFEKQLPEGRGIETTNRKSISANGDIVALKTFDSTGEIQGSRDVVYVFNKRGQTILTIPSDKDNENLIVNMIESISSNGKYLAVSLLSPARTRFYNLANKKYWDASKDYHVYEISSNGSAIVGSKDTPGKESPIDLKNRIGE